MGVIMAKHGIVITAYGFDRAPTAAEIAEYASDATFVKAKKDGKWTADCLTEQAESADTSGMDVSKLSKADKAKLLAELLK
jgi:hypothetical protein